MPFGFSLNSRRSSWRLLRPLCANNGLMHAAIDRSIRSHRQLGPSVGGTVKPSDLAARPLYKAPPPPPAPVFSWTGCYVGGNLGGGSTHKHFEFAADGQLFDEGTLDQGGFVGGGQLGCDYQFGSNFVVGVQGMFDG